MGWNDIFDKGKEWQQGLNMAASFAPQGEEYAQSNAGLRMAANLGGRLIDQGNNPKPLPMSKSYQDQPAAPDPASYKRGYSADIEQAQGGPPAPQQTPMPQMKSPGQEDVSAGQEEGLSMMKKAEDETAKATAASSAAQSQNTQQGYQNAQLATTIAQAAGYSI